MTWRNFKAYFDIHTWTRRGSSLWGLCSVCGEVRDPVWMLAREDALYPRWWLMRDGSIRIGDA